VLDFGTVSRSTVNARVQGSSEILINPDGEQKQPKYLLHAAYLVAYIHTSPTQPFGAGVKPVQHSSCSSSYLFPEHSGCRDASLLLNFAQGETKFYKSSAIL
jgi:hypothetical protein